VTVAALRRAILVLPADAASRSVSGEVPLR
jgi:hypothetical protein